MTSKQNPTLENTMTPREFKWFEKLRGRGFAVVVFTPAEVLECDSGDLEDYMIEKGWDYLENNSGAEPEDGEEE